MLVVLWVRLQALRWALLMLPQMQWMRMVWLLHWQRIHPKTSREIAEIVAAAAAAVVVGGGCRHRVR